MKEKIDSKNFDSKKHKNKIFKSKNKNKSNSLKNKADKKNQTSTNIYYSFLTIALLIFLCQVVFSAILNITKNISYRAKIATINKSKAEAETKNAKLKKELKYKNKIQKMMKLIKRKKDYYTD